MGDSFTEVSYNSFGGRLAKSVGGALIGVLLAVASVPVLWWNEGRTNWADVAKKSLSIPADASGNAGEGALVSVTGALQSVEPVGDPQFLKPGPYLALERNVEMYAWKETKHQKEEKQLGGSSKTITTYDYDEVWTADPQSSDDFRHPRGHENPELAVRSESFRAHRAKLAAFEFDASQAELPSAERFTPGVDDYLAATVQRGAVRTRGSEVAPTPVGEYLFQGRGSLQSPRIGDLRISFSAVQPLAKATLFGKRSGARIEAATVNGDESFFRVLAGSRDQAIGTLQTEHTVTTWLLRLAGFLMMWLGASAVFGPLNTLLDIVPIAGSASRFLVPLALLPITFGISCLVILTSIIAHSLILMALVVLASAGAVIFLVKRRRAGGAMPGLAT